MNNNKPIEIKKPHLMLCEGRDEQVFLTAIIDQFKKKQEYEKLDLIQILNFGGNPDLKICQFFLHYFKKKKTGGRNRPPIAVKEIDDRLQPLVNSLQKSKDPMGIKNQLKLKIKLKIKFKVKIKFMPSASLA